LTAEPASEEKGRRIKLFVRVRPFLPTESQNACLELLSNDKQIQLTKAYTVTNFKFDQVLN